MLSPIALRDPAPGDLGWVVERHDAVYAAEFGYGMDFERLVASIMAAWRPGPRSRGWIAVGADGTRVGSVFCAPWTEDPSVAQLRCLLVEPAARGTGLGGRLVDACVAFARDAGFPGIVLWTNAGLAGARRLYERAGFTVEWSEPDHAWGVDVVQERWSLPLT